jgi:hypothetical protein
VTLTPIAEDSGTRLITQAELLTNAGDIEGDTLTASALTISSGNGTLVDNNNGTWSYTSAADDDTAVSFSYTVSDGSLTAAGSASLDITPVNDAPTTTTTPVTLTPIAEDSGTRLITQAELLANASDIDGPSLTATDLVIATGSGTLVDNNNGTWSYTPAADDDTAVSFSYTVTDGSLTAAGSASLDITPVNDVPTTTPVTLSAIVEDSGARLITQADLLTNASDIDGPSLTATDLVIATGSGTLVDNNNGTWSYTPAADDDSAVSFSYTVSDGSLTAAGSASLDITAVNDAPTTTPVTLTPIAEDSGARLITQAELPANGGDIEGDTLTASALTISSGNGALVDNNNGTWSYTPAANDDSSVSFSYTISDGNGGSVAGSASLDITAVNDAPTTTPVTLTPIAEDSGARLITQAELLTNAGDIEGDTLTASALTISSGNGALVDNSNGTWSYTPASNDDSSVSFNYTISDGSLTAAGSASLDITAVNDTPTTTPVTLTPIAEDSGARLITQAELLTNAADGDGPSLTAIDLVIATGSGTLVDNSNGTWSYTPASNDDTAVSFSYTVSDGSLTAAGSASLDITPVNDAPLGTVTIGGTPTQGQTLTAADNLADADGLNTITYTWKAGATTLGTGTTYVLTEAEVGKLITVVASYTDGHGSAEAVTSSSTAAVTNVNDAPIGVVSIDNTTPAQGDTLTASNTLADADGLGTITYTWKADGSAVATGTTYVLTEAEVGKVITVVASYTDGHGTAESVVSVATALVSNVNDSPIGLPVITGEAIEDAVLTVDTSAVTDADGVGAFAYQWRRDGFAVPGATHANYVPGDADVGTWLSVEVTFTDGHGKRERVSSVVVGPVANVNDAPTMLAASINLRIGEALVLSAANIAASDVDSPIDSLVYSVSDVAGGWFERVARPGLAISFFSYGDLDAGAVRFAHDGSAVLPSFRVSASDGMSSSAAVVAEVSFDVEMTTGGLLQDDDNSSAGHGSRSTVDAASSTPVTLPSERPAVVAVAVDGTAGGPAGVPVEESIEQQLLVGPAIQAPVLQPPTTNAVTLPDASRRTVESEGFASMPLDDYLLRLVSLKLASAAHGGAGGELSAGEIGIDTVSGSETVTHELSV